MSLRSGARAERDRFVAFCGELQVEDGAPFTLHPFQRQMLADYFGGTRELALIIPKKNGKSTLMAALALFHLVVTPNAECIMVAASREQAEIILRQARMFIRRSAPLQRLMVIQQRSIISKTDEGRIRVLAADADTADGVIPTLAIVDELHRHKSAELYGVLRDGLGPRGGQLVTISTAGTLQDSPLGLLRRRAHDLPGFRRRGKHNYARTPDGTFAFHEWCLDADDDVDDMRVVKRVNPAPWQTLAYLRELHDAPTTTPWQWKRFSCGIWTEGEEPWIAPELWDRLADRELVMDPTSPVWLGVDIGVRHDTTAIAFVTRSDGRWDVAAEIITPGNVGVPLEMVERRIRELCESYPVQQVVYDPWAFRRSAEMLDDEGVPMLEYPQTPERMHMASSTLYRLIESGELRHSGDPALRAQVLSGVTKESERGWRLQKDPRSRRPIDALIALAIAAHVAVTQPDVEPLVMWA